MGLRPTSISSYSEQLNQVKYGHNKDHEPLPQLNLLLLYGEASNLPFYYRKLAGNIPDVKTVRTHETAYAKYFKVSKVKGGAKIEINRDAMQDAQARFGYFALMSNEIKDAREALLLYRKRDVVEKAFSNIKERLNGNRLLVSSEDA